MTGMPSPSSDPTSMMMYPDRRSASTSVPYSQTTRMGTATRVEPSGGWPSLCHGLFCFPNNGKWVSHPCVFCKGGRRCCRYDRARHASRLASLLRRRSVALDHVFLLSPNGASRFRREPRPHSLGVGTNPQALQVAGYVMMPEPIHLFLSEPVLSEPEVGTPSTVMQVWKQRSARALLPKNKPCDPRPIKRLGEISERAPFDGQNRTCLLYTS